MDPAGGIGDAEHDGGALRHARRAVATARNVAEVLRFGGLETGEQPCPFAVVAERPAYRLRRYFPDAVPPGALPLLLVPPLMITAEIYDVSPVSSAVAALNRAGVDAWVVDFGDPHREPGGRERNLTDHVLAVSDAVDRVHQATGSPVVLGGYSQGGMFAYQAAAYRRGVTIDSLVTLGSPVDTAAQLALPFTPEALARIAGGIVDSGLLRHFTMPGWMARSLFTMITPVQTVRSRAQFLLALHDREALLPRERQRRFIDSEGWTTYSGPAIAELLDQFIAHNRMLQGGFVIDDRLVTLADLDLDVLTVVGTTDTIGSPAAVRAVARAAPRARIYEVSMPSGHFGVVVGSRAEQVTWPAVVDWIRWRRGAAPLPDSITRTAPDVGPATSGGPRRLTDLRESGTSTSRAAAALGPQLVELGVGGTRFALRSARRLTGTARELARSAPTQLPRLSRLDRLRASTRISLGMLLAERARKAPQDVTFVFGDRAYRNADVGARVDAVVRGLLDFGVQRGDRIGVLMGARPSAFVVVAALSRLGATAVLLRPDGDVDSEVALGAARAVVCDRQHLRLHRAGPDAVRWAVLGAGSGERDLPAGVVDLERVVPGTVPVPGWFSADPQVASDLAFVLFRGEGAQLRAVSITNRRFALSALGTASAAALRPGDTVYSLTPLHHSSALLMSIGGAVAGGARFAMARAHDPHTFWDEVRRYGATHVSYTWTSLAPLLDAAPEPGEAHHPIRLFIGSGMPRNLRRLVEERFAPAAVLEFYASTGGEAVLANLGARAPGSVGRAVPGTAEVRVARLDLAARRLARGADGCALECADDEVGLLLERVSPTAQACRADGDVGHLRGVFAAGDTWRSTGDLFLRDGHGDLWSAGSLTELVDTTAGVAIPAGARYAIGSLPAVRLVVAYGVDAEPVAASDQSDRSGYSGQQVVHQVLCAAFTVGPGAGNDVSATDLGRVLGRMPAEQRPAYVQQVPHIPTTTWHRPEWAPFVAEGIPRPRAGRTLWRHDPATRGYELLTARNGSVRLPV